MTYDVFPHVCDVELDTPGKKSSSTGNGKGANHVFLTGLPAVKNPHVCANFGCKNGIAVLSAPFK